MGRRSYEEIGKPLPNRTTIVISSTKNYDGENCMTARSVAEAIEMAGDKDIYISGGARVYEEALPLVEKMYITEVDLEGMQTMRTLAKNMSFLMKCIALGKKNMVCRKKRSMHGPILSDKTYNGLMQWEKHKWKERKDCFLY